MPIRRSSISTKHRSPGRNESGVCVSELVVQLLETLPRLRKAVVDSFPPSTSHRDLDLDLDLPTVQVPLFILRRDYGSDIPHTAMAVELATIGGPPVVPLRAANPPDEYQAGLEPRLQG